MSTDFQREDVIPLKWTNAIYDWNVNYQIYSFFSETEGF